MAEFRYFHPIEVRYGDLDPQGHVNNAKYLTYFEQARVAYIQHLGLWDGSSFMDIGFILAEIRVTFFSPLRMGQDVRVGVRARQLGRKSFEMEYSLEDIPTSRELAHGTSVLVTYDYEARQSIPIPEVWRHALSTFEGIQKQMDTP